MTDMEMLMAREQLMEDIECIIESRMGDEYDGLIKTLCDAVCANFPSVHYSPTDPQNRVY